MTCTNCGGSLAYKNGIYVCENCGSKQQLSALYENIDVFICCVENDNAGRRTRDSVIAQELYYKLEAAKISTFYQRISASALTGAEAEHAYNTAAEHAKSVIVLGTCSEHFQEILEQNKNLFGSKSIFPVYADMDAYDLPEELKSLQALNYYQVGASTDLIKTILHTLGREDEVDIVQVTNSRARKRKRRIIVTISIILGLLIAGGAYIVLGTPYVLPGNKYKLAQDLKSQGDLAEAIAIFTELGDYENSSEELKNIYNRYDGYYQSEDKPLSLHLDVIDNLRAEIELKKIDATGDVVRVIESAQISGNIVSFSFTDSENNQGVASIELSHDSVRMTTTIQEKVGAVSVGDLDVSFLLNQKSDKPIEAPIDAQTLIGWISKKTTESDLRRQGYEFSFVEYLERNGAESLYKIDNTDVEFTLYNYDASKAVSRAREDSYPVNDKIIFSVSAPAEILLPDKIGSSTEPFVENDVLYFPCSTLGTDYSPAVSFWIRDEDKEDTISKSTPIGITSKALVGEAMWEELMKDMLEEKVRRTAKIRYGTERATSISCESTSDTYYLVSCKLKNISENNSYALYIVDKNTYTVQYVAEVPAKKDEYGTEEADWYSIPELAQRFQH